VIAADLTNFAQLSVAGLALGCLYALVALGFVIVLKSSGLLNLFQGGFALVGSYLTYHAHNRWGTPFAAAVLVAVAAMAVLAILIERLVVRRVRGAAAEWAVVLVTLGLLLVAESVVASIWGYDPLNMNDPWGLKQVNLGSVVISHRDLWVIGITLVLLAVFFVLFKFSAIGIAMRAAASDREAAYAQGISPNLVMGLSWAIAGIVGALAGIALGTAQSGGLNVGIGLVALGALPAVIFGGLYSPAGAVIGGIVVGLSQLYAAGYAPSWAGDGFDTVMPYIVLVIVLLVRPHGLFGRPEVRRA
jgi:branched-chain amino acid transport system permease protein